MKARILSLAMALAVCLGLLAVPASAAGSEFEIKDGILTKYKGSGGDVTIPNGVTEIWPDAFARCTGLTSVTIPGSVTVIRERAFYLCTGLTSATIGSGVAKIYNEAFSSCTSLTSITIPDSVTRIGAGAFNGCKGLTSVTIPDGVTKIGDETFSSCTGLTSVTIGSGVTKIVEAAFYRCSSLTSVVIPDGVTEIGHRTFDECTSLTSVFIPDSVTNIGFSAFDHTGLTDIYYAGTQEQWEAISIDYSYRVLKNAAVHYNSSAPAKPSTPSAPANPNTTNGGSHVSGWAVGNINNAEAAGLVPSWLMGADLTKSITRGDFAAAAVGLYRAMGGSTAGVNAENIFSDVSSSLNSYEDILLAKALGIANGKGGDRFDPNGTLTREEAAVMLCNVYKALGKTIPTVSATAFADDGGVSGWAKSAVAFMNQNGVVNGKGENKYDPQGLNAAEEALTMALNMLNKLK